MPFYKAFALVLLSFTTVFIAVSLLGFILANDLDLKKALFEWTNHFFLSIEFFKNYGFWFLVLNLTTAVLQINYKYGPGVLKKVLLGKYFKPQREERIFMFLDLRNSTAIAERLSEVEYFNLLKEIIEDITQPILYTRGEIYQYVGDEVVISWSVKNGKSNANCIRCYFEIQDVALRILSFL